MAAASIFGSTNKAPHFFGCVNLLAVAESAVNFNLAFCLQNIHAFLLAQLQQHAVSLVAGAVAYQK